MAATPGSTSSANRTGPIRVKTLLLAASLVLAACGGGSSDRSGGGSGNAELAPVATVRSAIAALNRWDLPAFCRHFAPEAIAEAPQLSSAKSCDDVLLQTLSTCEGCKRDLEIVSANASVSGDLAVVQATILPFRGSAQKTRKDIHLVRRDGKWLLVTNPDASLP